MFQDLFCVYLVLLVAYAALVALQVWANTRRQRHPITRLLAAQLATELAALFAASAHNAVFSADGVGVPWVGMAGDIAEVCSCCLVSEEEKTELYFSCFASLLRTSTHLSQVFSQSLFMLLLLLLAMGWAVTRTELKWRWQIFTVWLSYSLLHCLLYVWKKVCDYQPRNYLILFIFIGVLILCRVT